MKRFIKSVVILGLLLLPCFSHAQFTGDCVKTDIKTKVDLIGNYTKTTPSWYVGDMFKAWLSLSAGQTIHNTDIVDHGNYVCFTSAGSDQFNYCTNLEIIYNNTTYLIDSRSELACFHVEGEFDFHNPESTTCEWFAIVPNWYSDIITTQYTSLECQTEYNLIPISEVTKNYCELNFDLIDPLDCPSGGGSGTGVVFSNVYVNNVLYPSSADIYLNVNERLSYDITYNAGLMYVDIDFVGDEDYINGIVSINEYRPTSEDFTNVFVSGLTLVFPYIVITLFVLFIRKLIRKIFK